MLYTKAINEITYEDVQEFCRQNNKENEILEYKGTFTSGLDKVIASMANTYGGLILIGVNEDDGHPKPPFEGMEYEKKLQERVTQIAITVYPPVLPEIQVCSPNNGKTFIVIRIAESDITPHYIKQKTRAYIRTGIITKPENIADVNQLEWLINRREKSIKFREYLVDRAKSHFNNIGDLFGLEFRNNARQTISLYPLFPSKQLVEPEEIERFVMTSKVTPPLFRGSSKLLPTEDGWTSTQIKPRHHFYNFIEISKFGLIHQEQSINWKLPEEKDDALPDSKNLRYVYLPYILDSIISILNFANYFYQRIGFMGFVKLSYSLNDILNLTFNIDLDGRNILSSNGRSIIENLNLEADSSTAELNEEQKRSEFIISVIKRITWSVGSEFDPDSRYIEVLKKYINKFN